MWWGGTNTGRREDRTTINNNPTGHTESSHIHDNPGAVMGSSTGSRQKVIEQKENLQKGSTLNGKKTSSYFEPKQKENKKSRAESPMSRSAPLGGDWKMGELGSECYSWKNGTNCHRPPKKGFQKNQKSGGQEPKEGKGTSNQALRMAKLGMPAGMGLTTKKEDA